MRKISFLIAAVSAFMISCSSPYYPEYVPVVSLGASTAELICEREEGIASLNILANTEYTATLDSDQGWLRFADEESFVRHGKGNGDIQFVHSANNHDKRVATLVLAVGDYTRTIKIKQKGFFEDYLEIDAEDVESMLNGSDNSMVASVVGGEFKLRLKTSCLDHQIQCTTDHNSAISSWKVENKDFYFTLAENDEGQPRIINVTLSYVDGWGDTKKLTFIIRQGFQN